MRNFTGQFAIASASAVVLFAAIKPANAAIFSIGNSTGGQFLSEVSPFPEDFPGVSFTPSIQGDAGSGTSPLSGSVLLTSFALGSKNSGVAYVFDEIFTGTPSDLSNQTVGSSGFLGSSTVGSSGNYSFPGQGIKLADVLDEYFIYLDVRLDFEFAEGNPYLGGAGFASGDPMDPFIPGNAVGLDNPDLVFSATFTTAVPEPSTILGTTLALVFGALSRKRTRSNNSRTNAEEDLT